ncbi:MAG: polyphosphate kinase [Proteobacteria bacterium SG_bin6]|nr:MAG: polyphosphate kinase [Proteobacteria bacterium SG_bin6]
MTINLKNFEQTTDYQGDYDVDLKVLQARLARLQVAHLCHKRRAVIVFEGWDAAGKGGAIKRLTAEWDPRYFEVFPIAAPSAEERARHFLWRFWTRLPAAGNIAVFDRSWYGRVLVERVEGFASEPEWRRGYDEINEFEAQQADSGTTIIKLFLHITQKEQDKRLRERLEDPWKRWKTGLDDYRNRARRQDYLEAMAEMFRRTDTRWAPWVAIDANDKKAARIAALKAVADRLEAFVPLEPPPLDPELARVAKAALGE